MTNLRTSKRHHWRRYTTTMTLDTKRKLHSSSYPVHNSTSNLPDIVNDCHNRRDDSSHEMKSMCKEIAHSLRLVADHVDRKYCQVRVKNCFNYLFMFCFLSLEYRIQQKLSLSINTTCIACCTCSYNTLYTMGAIVFTICSTNLQDEIILLTE